MNKNCKVRHISLYYKNKTLKTNIMWEALIGATGNKIGVISLRAEKLDGSTVTA